MNIVSQSATLFTVALLSACMHSSNESQSIVAVDVQATSQSTTARSAQSTGVTQAPVWAIAYSSELRRATESRDKAQERCLGIVGAAKKECLAYGDQLFETIMHRAEISREAAQLSNLTGLHHVSAYSSQ